MSETPERGAAVAAFAERFGINRRRAALAGAVVGGVFLVVLAVMSQRMRERQAAMTASADSTADAPAVEADQPASPRAAWADPQEARRLTGDTAPPARAPGDTSGAAGFVPIGRDVGPGSYAEASRGDLGSAPAGGVGDARAAAAEPAAASPLDPAPDSVASPAELRRAAFRRAVASRRLRAAGEERDSTVDAGAGARSSTGFGGAAAAEVDTASGSRTQPLHPYGAQQVEEDRKAAERAAQQLPSPPPADLADGVGVPTAVRFASFAGRPCRTGERVLSAGYAITATLVSEINSEVPGPVLARVGRDVYDPRLACVVLPAGSLLIGQYRSGLAVGGRRLVVVWEQVRLADGRTWMLPALPAADRRGAPGVAGRVDRRTRETLESAALLSALGATIEYATPGGGQTQAVAPGGYPPAPSARDRAVGAATQPLRSAADRLLERAVDAAPVLHLEAGHPITVLVPRDVDLDHPAPAVKDTVPAAPGPSAPAAA
ncbi:MAG: conjugal transfer protein TrbI [Gemmatimonadetes bacterium]|nr:conjugal transfer protein TrbI [Gemmatimonadota bacterium]